MNKVAMFEKISLSQFRKDWISELGNGIPPETIYELIELPRRGTAGSAGYDFFTPVSITLEAGQTVRIPTGIRANIEPGWVLMLYPRSGLGFRYRLQMDNTVGVIDSDYYGSENEGHIFAKLTNCSLEQKTVKISKGTGFMQGIFTPYGITFDDACTELRNGGFGSTTK